MSDKIKIYEIARSMNLGIKGSELVALCQRAGFKDIKHHSNAVTPKEAEDIKKAALRLYKPTEESSAKVDRKPPLQPAKAPLKSTSKKKAAEKTARIENVTPIAPPKPKGKMGKKRQLEEEKAPAARGKAADAPSAPEKGKEEQRGRKHRRARQKGKADEREKPTGPVRKKRTVVFKQSRKQVERKKITRIEVTAPVTVRELSGQMGVGASELIRKLMLEHKIKANINDELERDIIELLALDYGIEVDLRSSRSAEELLEDLIPEDRPEDLQPRPPIVTLLGHVDHGKTSILDQIRQTRVAEGEDGGITQDIGAWQIRYKEQLVTFVDTPGHEAFTAMRARGANVTDIVVLVVAVDDGVMAQTEEAISHARAAGAPIVVALNKIDKPDANIMQTLQQLSGKDLVAEQWGGECGCVELSALTGKGMDELLERILLEVELLELKGNPNRHADGVVLEAKKEEGIGVVANIIVRNGLLKKGDVIVCGPSYGRLRLMRDQAGAEIESAGPSTPAAVCGLDGVPEEGEKFVVVEGLDRARAIAEERRNQMQEERRRPRRRVTLENLYESLQADATRKLRLIVKADAKGSLDPLINTLEDLNTDEVGIEVLHRGVGAINMSDVLLADASDAVILAFRVATEEQARKAARDAGIEIKNFRVIYHAIESLKKALEGMLAPAREEVRLGVAEVRAVFNISRIGTIAGCYVQRGEIQRGRGARLQRDGKVVYEGRIESLRREKNDARQVETGFECGIGLERYNDIKVGDLIECFTVKETARTLG